MWVTFIYNPSSLEFCENHFRFYWKIIKNYLCFIVPEFTVRFLWEILHILCFILVIYYRCHALIADTWKVNINISVGFKVIKHERNRIGSDMITLNSADRCTSIVHARRLHQTIIFVLNSHTVCTKHTKTTHHINEKTKSPKDFVLI